MTELSREQIVDPRVAKSDEEPEVRSEAREPARHLAESVAKQGRYALSGHFTKPTEYDPAWDQADPAFVERFLRVVDLAAIWFRPSFHGIEHVPKTGPALLVGNHGIIGFDAAFIFNAVYKTTGRILRGLGDRHLFVAPGLRQFWKKVGALDGTPAVAEKFLKAGALVNVYPGGARDAMKEPEGRYKLHWHQSKGFIRLAMRTEVPIILHIGIGTDDTYRIIGKLNTGRLLGHRKYDVPLWLGWGVLPRPVKFDYYFSAPIALAGNEADKAQVDANHELVWRRAKQMLADGLRQRRSIWFG